MGISGVAGLIDLAIRRNSLIGGDDFKSGQTKMKSVLVDFLVGAGIKVYIVYVSTLMCDLFVPYFGILILFLVCLF